MTVPQLLLRLRVAVAVVPCSEAPLSFFRFFLFFFLSEKRRGQRFNKKKNFRN